MAGDNINGMGLLLDNLTRGILCLGLAFSLAFCGSPHRLEPLSSVIIPGSENRCAAPFVTENRQFIHSIEAELTGGGAASVIGVTNVYPQRKVAHCVIMTVEGFVLFEAVYDQEVRVERGIPPFDSKAFAEGLMRDIALIFFRPSGELIGSAVSAEGDLTCRYDNDNGGVEDIRIFPNNAWDIRLYRNGELERSVKAEADSAGVKNTDPFIPEQLALTAYGKQGYSLKLRLIETTRLKDKMR
jgi:hypothetical protein